MRLSARQAVLGALAAVGLVVAIVLAARALRAREGLPATYMIDGVCLKCAQSGQFEYSAKADQPLKCPKCGERAVYSWMYCNACRRRFVPNLVSRADGPPALPMAPVCTACGSSNAGAYIAEDTTQQPVGDAPLPKWPP